MYEEEILLVDDPKLDRIRLIYQNLQQKGFPHIALIRKSGDTKIYHKATQEIFTIKKQCEANSNETD